MRPNIERSLCECGCGEFAKSNRRFIINHSARVMTDEHRRKIGEANKRRYDVIKNLGLKECSICFQVKATENFGRRNSNGHRRSACRECEAEKSREWRSKNPEKFRRAVRNAATWVEYGIRYTEYEEIVILQGNTCAICHRLRGKRRRLSIDHSHVTNEIRGLLCSQCNIGLGCFEDNPKLLRDAATYIETARTGKIAHPRRGRRGGGPKHPIKSY